MTTTEKAKQFRRLRVFVRAVFILGIVASIGANVLHADPNPISQAVAAWAPVALLLAVEIITRIPLERHSWRSWLRILATGTVALIAAWVSYWHIVGVTAAHGETGITPYLIPVSVDGLIVIASISLMEINSRYRALSQPITEPEPAEPEPATDHTTDQEHSPTGNTDTDPLPAPPEPVPPEPAPAVSPALMQQARLIASAHHNATGHSITADDLAGRMHITSDTARAILADIHASPRPAPVNGHAITTGTAGHVQEALL